MSKPARRFVSEALYGIAARGSVRLSEIGRALEETIALAKTETRLSRSLGRTELRAHLGAAVLRAGGARIGARTLLVLDISDIAKRYAEKMEYLARVRDDSSGAIADGYWLCQVIGVENETAVLAAQRPMLYATHIVREEKGREVCCRLDYGFQSVRLPEHPDVPLWLVVVRGLGETPIMPLTNLSLRKNRKVLWWVVSAYLSRWRIEEAIRFVKQGYDLEDIRVLTYERLRNMAVLVNAVAFFTAVVLGTRVKLDILATHLLRASKRLFGVPDFRLYALADAIRKVCARSPRRSQPGAKDPPQLALGFD